MLAPQNIRGLPADSKLGLSWEIPVEYVGISVQIGEDIELVANRQTFVIPPKVTGISLDCGAGGWYFRVGGWVGTKERGTIEWSGVYGPFRILGARRSAPIFKRRVDVHHTQAIMNGLRFHTGLYEPYYAIVEYSKMGKISANTAKTVYRKDENKGTIDISDLPYENTYTVQVSGFSEEIGNLPENSIKFVVDGKPISGRRSSRPDNAKIQTDVSVSQRDKAILREESEGRRGKFSSYSEYMQYIAAKARMEEKRAGV